MENMEKFTTVMQKAEALRQSNGVNIGKKQYLMVKDRIELFRITFADDYGIQTNVEIRDIPQYGLCFLASAKIVRPDGYVVSTGHSMATYGMSKMMDQSPIEIAETSAIGRALAGLGLHGGEFASAIEIEKASFESAIGNSAESTGYVSTNSAGSLPQRTYQGEATVQNNAPPPRIPEVSTGLFKPYVPTDIYNTDPWEELGKVADSITHISSRDNLSQYWSMLQEYRKYIEVNEPACFAEMKRVFVSAAPAKG